MSDLSAMHRTCFSPPSAHPPQNPSSRPPSEHSKPAALLSSHAPPQPREMLSSPGNLFIIRPILLLADWSPVQRKMAGKSLCRQRDVKRRSQLPFDTEESFALAPFSARGTESGWVVSCTHWHPGFLSQLSKCAQMFYGFCSHTVLWCKERKKKRISHCLSWMDLP